MSNNNKTNSIVTPLYLFHATDDNNNKVRNTFGIRKPDGEFFSDIITSSRHIMRLTISDLYHGFIKEPCQNGKYFRILIDNKVLEKFRESKEVKVILSFQQRTNGNYAICRVFRGGEKK